MISIKKSQTADTRTCDWSKVTEETLLQSSRQHIGDVQKGLGFLCERLSAIAQMHDFDKISEIQWFYKDFKTGFKQTTWLDNHRKINRHHIDNPNGIPDDVNLIDVLEHIVDCVMAGMARSGNIYPIQLSNDLLQKALENTVSLLKNNITIEE